MGQNIGKQKEWHQKKKEKDKQKGKETDKRSRNVKMKK